MVLGKDVPSKVRLLQCSAMLYVVLLIHDIDAICSQILSYTNCTSFDIRRKAVLAERNHILPENAEMVPFCGENFPLFINFEGIRIIHSNLYNTVLNILQKKCS